MKENFGVIVPEIKPGDFIAGSFSDIPYSQRCTDWSPYLPTHETQFSNRDDWMDCVSESYHNAIETQMMWMLKTNQFTKEQIDEMKALNYFDDNGVPNFSDRYLAKMSGTTRSGNSVNTVAEAAKKYGLIGEKDWGETLDMDWNAYYAEIPQNIKDKAKRIFDFINIGNKTDSKGNPIERTGGYEWVVTDSNNSVANYKTINQALKREVLHAPIQITVPICPSYHKRETVSPVASCPINQTAHAMLFYKFKDLSGRLIRLIFDSYPPFRIELENNYPLPYCLKIIASPVKVKHTITTDGGQISTAETPAFWERFKDWLRKFGVTFVEKVGGLFRK